MFNARSEMNGRFSFAEVEQLLKTCITTKAQRSRRKTIRWLAACFLVANRGSSFAYLEQRIKGISPRRLKYLRDSAELWASARYPNGTLLGHEEKTHG